jgi:hypothetical protein
MERQRGRQRPSFVERRQGDTLLNAVIGAAAGFVLSFTGVGVILGGGVAGYLQNEGKGAGAKVGALSGALGVLPTLALLALVAGWIGGLGIGVTGIGLGSGAAFGGAVALVLLVVFLFVVVLSALGGFVGGLLADDGRSGRRRRNF